MKVIVVLRATFDSAPQGASELKTWLKTSIAPLISSGFIEEAKVFVNDVEIVLHPPSSPSSSS